MAFSRSADLRSLTAVHRAASCCLVLPSASESIQLIPCRLPSGSRGSAAPSLVQKVLKFEPMAVQLHCAIEKGFSSGKKETFSHTQYSFRISGNRGYVSNRTWSPKESGVGGSFVVLGKIRYVGPYFTARFDHMFSHVHDSIESPGIFQKSCSCCGITNKVFVLTFWEHY
ncbi:hypothetical protein DPX16_2919 [Anabarilius grahami]|uniref:Uncharacterized protein n=1 Tax=Anabarilius grahami TaxID=495550 RepID=A0A3N0Y515_ANAGA|nr:hypothetical protein DPX16_2919 [Anabarilius grahami]